MSRTRNLHNLAILAITFLSFVIPATLPAQKTDTTASLQLADLSNTVRIDASLLFGFGFKEFDVFKTNRDEMVSLSPGGGVGIAISLGYYFSELICVDAAMGLQSSLLSKELKNADGSFDRTFINGTVRYKFPLSQSSSINAGAGAGYYMSGEMDIDAHKIDGGAHNIYYFKDTPGFHIICEYEELLPNLTFMNAKWSWLIGLKYYSITYEIESARTNGIRVPVEFIPEEILKDFKDLDGSGIDITVSMVMHF